MPIVEVSKDVLKERLHKDYTEKEFNDLCFDFGIELDEVTSEFEKLEREQGKEAAIAANADKTPLYKIDVPANRYDLLCVEGLVKSLQIFLGVDKIPEYTTIRPSDDAIYTMTVKPNTKRIRPYIVAAVLRNVTFDEVGYQSFIDYQDKMHFNICRKRTLVAIGTHDLDSLTPQFEYDARAPTDIKFKALKEEKEMTAEELFNEYNSRPVCALKEYLHIIEDSPVYPVIYDSKGVVLSMPPIINGEHSKICLDTKNVFIESTATDLTKANIVLNSLVTAFGCYCKEPFIVEQVKIVYETSGEVKYTPDFTPHEFKTSVEYINKNLGTELTAKEVTDLLYRMSLKTKDADKEGNLVVLPPPSRSDILHAMDIVEDVAIAYGYNNIVRRLPHHSTTAGEFPLNAFSDKIRNAMAQCGFSEVLNWALTSKQEAYERMRIEDKGLAAEVMQPKSQEFEILRVNLLPGVLKTLSANMGHAQLPLQLFEVGDVVLLDKSTPEGSRNERRLSAVVCSSTKTGFEFIHGVLDRIMEQNEFVFLSQQDLNGKYKGVWPTNKKNLKDKRKNSPRQMYYSLLASDRPSFFPQRQAAILVDGLAVGYFGVVHPAVLNNYGIWGINNVFACALELNLEVFM